MTQTAALLSNTFTRQQVEQSTKEEVQQYMYKEVDVMLYFYTLKIVLYLA